MGSNLYKLSDKNKCVTLIEVFNLLESNDKRPHFTYRSIRLSLITLFPYQENFSEDFLKKIVSRFALETEWKQL